MADQIDIEGTAGAADGSEPPVIRPRLEKGRKGAMLAVIDSCPHCGEEHRHGWGGGHRVAHCRDRGPSNPGYILDCGEEEAPRDAPVRSMQPPWPSEISARRLLRVNRAAEILRIAARSEAARLNRGATNGGTEIRSAYHDAIADLADVVVSLVVEMER